MSIETVNGLDRKDQIIRTDNDSSYSVHGEPIEGEKIDLQDLRLFRQYAYLNGKWSASEDGDVVSVINPATDFTLGAVPDLSARQIEETIIDADAAFLHWNKRLADDRSTILVRWYKLILENKQDLAHLLVLEQGKTLSEALGEIEYGASFILWFSEEARRSYGATIPSHIRNAKLMTARQGIGVSALITPWNFPSAMIARKAAAALAIGCSVIVKPAPETPFSALALAELADRAGIPAGVFNVVTGDAIKICDALCRSPNVRALSFTGSTRVGRLLLERAASTVKKCSMELGGNAPFIVLDDMDIEAVAKSVVEAKFQTSGQDCLAANRIFVPKCLYDDFLNYFEWHVERIQVGNGLHQDVDMGPLINEKAVKKANDIVEDAVTKGARLIVGNQEDSPGKNYFMPTLLADVSPNMRVFEEENFSPIAGVMTYNSIDEVIDLANNTEYGLAAYVFGNDNKTIWRLVSDLQFGMISVNSVKMTGHPIPFGGMKQSGLGREGGIQGLEEFSEIKYCCFGGL